MNIVLPIGTLVNYVDNGSLQPLVMHHTRGIIIGERDDRYEVWWFDKEFAGRTSTEPIEHLSAISTPK